LNSFEDHSLSPTATVAPPARNLIAPVWHTIALIAALLFVSLASAGSQAEFTTQHGRMAIYLTTFAWEWLLTFYVIWGLRKMDVPLREIIGERWKDPVDALVDIGLAAAFWVVSAFVLAGMAYAMGLAKQQNIQAARDQIGFLFPHSGIEILVWALLSATAGFCEEIVFRGYLQTQLARMSGITWIGIIGQSAVFGGSHFYEGGQRVIIIAVWGVMFGALALWRRSLRPGMIAHGFHDFFTGIAGRVLLGG
jgi:membrane protease YdiL (CAAX protease family)